MLVATDLWYRYRPDLPWVLRGESIAIAPGQVLGLVGPSGTGKSTLGRLLAGLSQPERGRIEVDAGPTPTGAAPVQLVLQHAERAMNPRWRVRDVLAEPGASAQAVGAIQHAMLDPAWLDRFPHEISGGELQRVNLARALLAQPRYVIADEITASLDPLTQAEIWHALTGVVADRDIGVLVISHDRPLLAATCDPIVEFGALGPAAVRAG